MPCKQGVAINSGRNLLTCKSKLKAAIETNYVKHYKYKDYYPQWHF